MYSKRQQRLYGVVLTVGQDDRWLAFIEMDRLIISPLLVKLVSIPGLFWT